MSLMNVPGVDTCVILQEVIPVYVLSEDVKTNIHHPNLCDHFGSRDDTDPAHLFLLFSPF